MPQIHGKNSFFRFEDTTGASVNLSGDGTNVTLTESVRNVENNAIDSEYTCRGPCGLSDANVSYQGWANSTSGLNLDIFSTMKKRQGLVVYAPGGSESSNRGIRYAACMRMVDSEIQSPVGSIVAVQASFELSSGSVSTYYYYRLLLENGDYILSEAGQYLAGEYI